MLLIFDKVSAFATTLKIISKRQEVFFYATMMKIVLETGFFLILKKHHLRQDCKIGKYMQEVILFTHQHQTFS